MLKRILDDNYGFTYTLEAILGIFLIMGTVVYVTTNMPYTAQKTGEHSKVQLMNIGRDTLDLTLITPVYETCPSCVNAQVARLYLLVADKTFVMPGETVNFNVTYVNGTPVNRTLTLQETILDSGQTFTNMTTIYNTASYSWSNTPQNLREFSIHANDFAGGVSNDLTIKVGWYFLDSDTNGIFVTGNVSGWVYNASGPVNGLTINLAGPVYSRCGYREISYPAQTMTRDNGNFSFIWPASITTGGIYYINATDGVNSSNNHLLTFSQTNAGATLWARNGSMQSNQSVTIDELDSADLFEINSRGNPISISTGDLNNFYINNIPYNSTSIVYSITINSDGTAKFTANLAGDYYIYQQSGSCGVGVGPVKTNSILIHVLPFIPATGDTKDNCVNSTELNLYMRRYMPVYVNYNLYLIDPTGNRFKGCPDFYDPASREYGELINGYPTAKAMAVTKLAHIKYEPTKVDNILEYRMVLWYK